MKRPYWTCTCPDCGTVYRGGDSGTGHCRAKYGGCCNSFANDATAHAHMTSDHPLTCLTPQQMLDLGWEETARGWTWNTPLAKAKRKELRDAV